MYAADFLHGIRIFAIFVSCRTLINIIYMEQKKKRIEYTNGEIVVVWQPHLCIHAGVCVKMLPEVYRPSERPWVKLENSTTDKIIAQVEKCPSGALSYRKA